MEMFIPIVAIMSVFGTTFGIAYLFLTARNRERLALIEKGKDASIFYQKSKTGRLDALKWGLVAIGVGLGMWVGSMIGGAVDFIDPEAAIFSMLLVFGGISLLIYYWLTRNMEDDIIG